MTRRYLYALVSTLAITIGQGAFAQTEEVPWEGETPPEAPVDRILGDVQTEGPIVVENPYVHLQEKRAMGERAYADSRFLAAEGFFREYWKGAWNEDVLVEATTLLVRAMLAQAALEPKKSAAALAVLDGMNGRLAILPTPPAIGGLSPRNQMIVNYWRGRVQLSASDLKAATENFALVAESVVDPVYKARGHIGLGEVYLARRDWERAEKEFSNVQVLTWEQDENRQATLGLIRALNAQEKYDQASLKYRGAVREADESYARELGMLHLATLIGQAKTMEALVFFKEHFSEQTDYITEPDHYRTLLVLGQSLAAAKQPVDAVYVYKKLLPLVRLERQKQELIQALGETSAATGDHPAAITYFRSYLKNYPASEQISAVTVSLAFSLVASEQAAEAMTLFSAVAANNDADPQLRYTSRYQHAKLLAAAKEFAKASNEWQLASLLPVSADQKADALYQAGMTNYEDIKDYSNAGIIFKRTADTYPQSSRAADARFNEGLARQQEKSFDLAASAFSQFEADFPDHEKVGEAIFQQGQCLRLIGAYDRSIKALKTYATRFKETPKAPEALLIASLAASGAGRTAEAVQLLDDIERDHRDSPQYPRALYERAFLRIGNNSDNQRASEDGLKFLELYSTTHPEMATDVYLWLGDHYAGLAKKNINPAQNFQAAEGFFREVYTRYPKSPDAPTAVYEAAKNAYFALNNDRALIYLKQLADEYPNAPARVKSWAQFLHGDIASLRGDFKQAAEHFQKTAELQPQTLIAFNAMGRRAECLATLARGTEDPAEKAALFTAALEIYTQVIDAPGMPASVVMKSRYSAGRIYEQRGETQEAIQQYYDVFYTYVERGSKERFDDWVCFSLAGFDLAKLYRQTDRNMQALRVYEDLERFDIPRSAEAAALAASLRALDP